MWVSWGKNKCIWRRCTCNVWSTETNFSARYDKGMKLISKLKNRKSLTKFSKKIGTLELLNSKARHVSSIFVTSHRVGIYQFFIRWIYYSWIMKPPDRKLIKPSLVHRRTPLKSNNEHHAKLYFRTPLKAQKLATCCI